MRLTAKKPLRQEMVDMDDEDSHYSSKMRKSSKMFQQKMGPVEIPEMNFLTARAKIKLKVMKKYEEDEHKK